MGRLFQYASPGDGSLYVVGVFSGALTGIARGFFGLLMMRSITALAPSNPSTLFEDGLTWSLAFLGVGTGVLVLNTISWSCLAVAGEHLTKNLRLELMEKLLHFEVGYFDFEENCAPGLPERSNRGRAAAPSRPPLARSTAPSRLPLTRSRTAPSQRWDRSPSSSARR